MTERPSTKNGERTAYLHIGMHKTGTTAIQIALRGYDDGRLAYARFQEPQSLPFIVLFSPEPLKPPVVSQSGVTAENLSSFRQSFDAALQSDLDRRERDILWSAEDLTEINLARPLAEKLTAKLRSAFDSIRAIGYVRDRSFSCRHAATAASGEKRAERLV